MEDRAARMELKQFCKKTNAQNNKPKTNKK